MFGKLFKKKPKRNGFDQFIEMVLQNEGYYVSQNTVFDLGDGAGMTHKSGITESVYAKYLGKNSVTKAEMKAMTMEDIRQIYKHRYWDSVGADALPDGLALCVADMGVNAGPSRARRLLQRAVGAKEDGVIGPKTMAAIESQKNTLIDDYSNVRIAYYKRLKQFPKFGKGWLHRVETVRDLAKKVKA
ncbi:MAG: hypothetical protein N0C84_00475 [Candidatus Thiodiazotropha taylori]|uniref:Secretion activator protein n=1 Tax=Candidatus Thiodiazotropha taylori TaxID=2792791 RepID=A0A9E4N336_9GAMM|nr:hypothetical protein [Candidatus Thiodiazotropha taylori]MCW4254919.1 hypothetical protein [Candidatus Thiodiazotropha taylori]